MVEQPRISVDVGGTFTDVTLVTGDELVTAKVPSTADQSEGVIDGIRKACSLADIEPDDIYEFAHAMTVSTNTLLERDGARTALVTTEGFRDVLEIGRQTRPALYDLSADKPSPLVPRRHRYELSERTTIDGIEEQVDQDAVHQLADELQSSEIESVAVVFLHAYAHPQNEQKVTEILRSELDVPVSASHEVLAEFREFERTATTTADAYVTPRIDTYLGHLQRKARTAGIPKPRVMQSNGGITDASTVRERAVTTALSGPAAGVVGANRTADPVRRQQNLDGLVTLDMGGTSSDVSLVHDGEVERTTDTTIDGVPIRVPMVDVHTIGSGGGSIAWADSGGALRVGPESAGSNPGPACYGNGGEQPTVTDANVVLGYIGSSTAFGGELSLNESAAHKVLADLATAADLDSALEAAHGVYEVTNASMGRAVRSVTLERGYDPRKFGLVAFGGAGPMHAARVATDLGIETVIVPVTGGVLSAYGLLTADEQYDEVRTYLTPLNDATSDEIERIFADLEEDSLADITNSDNAEIDRGADIRYAGQSYELSVPVETTGFDTSRVTQRFHEAHEQAYGYSFEEDVELVNLRVRAHIERDRVETGYNASGDSYRGTRTAYFDGEAYETAVYRRQGVKSGVTVEGPAILEQPESTTVVPPAWSGTVQADGTLVLTRGETA